MPAPAPSRSVNRLLQRVTRVERGSIVGCCETVELLKGDVVSEAGQPFRHVYFPLNALITTVSRVEHHLPLEVAMIGNEGMLGSTIALGINNAVLDAYVRGPGAALRLGAGRFCAELGGWPVLQRTINRYLYVLMAQMAQNTLCTRFHALDTRLARWLLMTHDRTQSDAFYLTHKSLSELLGMRRSGVTIAAGHLQDKGYIHYTRGHITILDRAGLEIQACECYRNDKVDYERSLA